MVQRKYFGDGEELARILREPLGKLAEHCVPAWGNGDALNSILAARFSSIPYCSRLYCMGFDGIHICNDFGLKGILLPVPSVRHE
jgi:hypothetical protein